MSNISHRRPIPYVSNKESIGQLEKMNSFPVFLLCLDLIDK